MNVKVRDSIPMLAVVVLVVAADALVLPILQESTYRGASATTVFASDFIIVLLTGLAGLFFASRVGCPTWCGSRNGIPTSRRAAFVTLLLGILVVVSNTLICMASRSQLAELAPWFALLTPRTAIVIAFRAALTENIVFRLFLFSLVAWVAKRFMRSQRGPLVVGALASALLYGLIHPGLIVAFLGGLALNYIYYRCGLLAAMAVHFFGDAIPFVLLSMMR